jgi:hypothetical protein
VIAQDLTLLLESLRIIRGTTNMSDPHQRSPRRAGHGLCLLPGCGQDSRRICMRSPAEHHINQDYGNLRVAGSLEQVWSAYTRVDHRVWPALGKLLCA